MEVLWGAVFFGSASIAAVLVAGRLHEAGADWLPALLSGAVAGAIGVWLVWWVTWHITVRITRGAPFRTGDPVEITAGEHQGATGTVSEVFGDRYAVRVALGDRSDEESDPAFYWAEIRRAPTK